MKEQLVVITASLACFALACLIAYSVGYWYSKGRTAGTAAGILKLRKNTADGKEEKTFADEE